jgi:hypothetical protein
MARDSVPEAGPSRFPSTRRSAVLSLGSDDPVARARSFEILVRAYFRPVYGHVRMRWRRGTDEARELTQAFFAQAYERRYFATYEPAKSHFRTYLKLCVDRFVGQEAKRVRRLKRGGAAVLLSLDFESAEAEVVRAGGPVEDPEAHFDRAWVKSLFALALDHLQVFCKARGKDGQYRMFAAVALETDPRARPSYAALAAEHGVSISDVTNHLAAMRREFRRIALESLRELTASEEEFEAEARAIFGKGP